jgi:methionine-rich copper-binding protein CopC
MKSLSRFPLLFVFSLALISFTSGCGDESPSGGGAVDTSPPSVLTVSAADGQHVTVVFDEDVARATAEEPRNYAIGEHVLSAAPDAMSQRKDADDPDLSPAQTEIVSAALVDARTVLLSISGFMQNIAYDIRVSHVSDVHGNIMTEASMTEFQGSDAPDTTPPSIVWVTPARSSSGAATTQPVTVAFSEPMQDPSVFEAFLLQTAQGKVAVAMQKREQNVYSFTPVLPMNRNTLHTVVISGAAFDYAGNPLPSTSWTFRTTGATDDTPPALVSTTPIDGATNVSTSTSIELVFSEPIDRTSIEGVMITPVPGEGIEEWLNGDRTVRFTPYDPLLGDTQYLLVIPAGFIRDLAGNGNADSYTIQFTTGSSFASGRIEGTLSGDPYSVAADDPTGAIVVATTVELFGQNDEIDILGVGFVAANDTYAIERLPDGTYYPFALLDSNGDGIVDPEMGDAFGAYGVDVRNQDLTQLRVFVTGGSTESQIDFPLFDPVTIAGSVIYDGDAYASELTNYNYYAGAFDAATFDPDNPGVPAASTEDGPLAWDPHYTISQLDNGLDPGTYYVGGYLDVNSNGLYDPDVDPAGFYASPTGEPRAVTVENGTDFLEVDIHIDDPQGALSMSSPVPWGSTRSKVGLNPGLKRALDKIKASVRAPQ